MIASLTFAYDGLFNIATDQLGRTYRVLSTTGRDGHRQTYLSPWKVIGLPTWKGRTIAEGHPLYPSIREAEDVRVQGVIAEADAKRVAGAPLNSRFESEWA